MLSNYIANGEFLEEATPNCANLEVSKKGMFAKRVKVVNRKLNGTRQVMEAVEMVKELTAT